MKKLKLGVEINEIRAFSDVTIDLRGVVEVIRDEKTQEVLERRIYLKAAKLEEEVSGNQNIPATNKAKSFTTPHEKSFARSRTNFRIEYK